MSQLPADREQRADVPISELELPEAIRCAAARAASYYSGSQSVRALSFREKMREEAAKSAAAETADPWRLTLERVRGKVDFFDRLGACQQSNVAGFA